MNKEKNEVVVSVRETMHDYLKIIDKELKNIKKYSENTYQTNGKFSFTTTNSIPIDIHKALDLSLLISILSFLNDRNESYNKTATDILKLEVYPQFKWLGFNYDSWENDIKIRISQITYKEKINKFESAKKKLENFLTEEDRLKLTLDEISKMLR